MNSIKVIIVDDEEIWATQLEMFAEKFGFEVVANFNDATNAMMQLAQLDFDIALLDINMNGKNIGIELGKLICNTYHKPFIFITGSFDHHTAQEAITAKPSAYLTKPFNDTSLYVAIHKAIDNFEKREVATSDKNNTTESFFVKVGNKYKRLEWQQVIALVSEKKYTKIKIANDDMEYLIGNTLPKTLQHILPKNFAHRFVQINRAEVINCNYITELKGYEVITTKGIFEATDGYIKQLKELLNLV
ncbi:MAG: LytR/AlgR family response regulator transcription factor [Chitinophagaceae bacterium]